MSEHGDIYVITDEIAQIQKELVICQTRFDNGRHAMADMRARIEKLEPKAPDWVKLLLAGLTIIGVLMGAQMWLTDRFNARPTRQQVEKLTAPIEDSQKETSREIADIERTQGVQAESIKNIESEQVKQGNKIDLILERLPSRRRSNR